MVTTLHFEEKDAVAKLLVLQMESVFIHARFKGREDEGLEHHSLLALCEAEEGRNVMFLCCVFSLVSNCHRTGWRYFPL